jgi:hypothetical protein
MILMSILMPVGAWALAWAADRIAQRRGESRLTGALRKPRQWRRQRKLSHA